ncbi:uncharacterized protein LY89DRAFT_759926 [Mollisia scopiformis]|uniref:Uncharacterized protein n=1 Tax=Mollisia scopiformis TaxID=149040 RepID=A0A194WTE0_MOLSC|nr:uncharacterized protein LY89DRAFT_759926 [Mollisia scopiformis]KUJ10939.1 hypothetical protein LY89DRAFT_759926 [Mollisia scopiformis]
MQLKGCLLLTLLPIEIRQKIYRELFLRPVGIVPGPIRYKPKICYRNTTINIYSYQWESHRQSYYDEWGLPHYDGSPESFTKEWITKPTEEEVRLMEDGILESAHETGVWKLPDIKDEEGTTIYREIRNHGGRPEVLNCTRVMSTGFENTFVFNTRGNSPFTHHQGVHVHDVFSKNRALVPGLPFPDGRPVSQRQIQTAIEKMFDKDKYQPLFVARDPLAKFFNIIGRENASKIRKIVIEGFFKTAEENERYKFERPNGLGQILPIHTTILRNVCIDLQQLTIFLGEDDELWNDDLEKQSGLTDEDRIDKIIAGVVHGLSNLQQLRLENRTRLRGVEGQPHAYNKQKEDVAAIKAKKDERMELDQYIWKEEGFSKRGRGGRGGGRGGRGRERGGYAGIGRPVQNSFAALIDQAVAAAGNGECSSTSRPSFRKG